jgi:hypothetical protein
MQVRAQMGVEPEGDIGPVLDMASLLMPFFCNIDRDDIDRLSPPRLTVFASSCPAFRSGHSRFTPSLIGGQRKAPCSSRFQNSTSRPLKKPPDKPLRI